MDGREIWSLRIKEARDLEALKVIESALSERSELWVRPCLIQIAAHRMRMRQASKANTSAGFAATYGIPTVDGRHLYAYRLDADAFARLERDLVRRPLASLTTGSGAALFVLWASEWFRRRYRGGGHRWAELCATLDVAEDQALLRQLTGTGLKQWGRPVLSGGGGLEYLGSLAREGGFPAAAVEDGGKGWAQEVLRLVVAPLLAEPAAGEERARELAGTQQSKLPQLFQDDDFVALCADLAMGVVAIRREADAPAAAAGLPVVAWLELHQPDWRDRLPLTTGERTADALVDGLMKVEAVASGAAGVTRFLERTPDGWREAVRLTLDGALDGTTTRGLDPGCGRLRVFAAGEMARAIPGELAMLEPPGEGDSEWELRSTRHARGIQPLPFAAAVELDLRQGEQRVSRIAIAGGKARRGALLVAVAEDDSNSPKLLRVVGSGSGHYRADPMVVQVPVGWRLDATAGETVAVIGPGMAGTTLWRVSGGAFVTDPTGDRHRILCGQPRDQPSRIELIGDPVRWAEVTGDIDLFQGAPLARVGTTGTLCRRAIGERSWTVAPSPLPVGHYELGWRRDGVLLDRRRVAVLPREAVVRCSGRGKDVRYACAGWEGAGVAPAADAPVRGSADTWWARPAARPAAWFDATLTWPDAPPLLLRIAYPHEAAIARWEGPVLPPDAQVTLAELPDLVAVDGGRMAMFGELVERGNRGDPAVMRWEFDGELPMSSVAADIASMLLPGSNDAKVRIGMLDGIETYWSVRPFAIRLQRQGNMLVATEGVVAPAVEVCGRAFADPATEVSFGPYSLMVSANHRPFGLPPGRKGDWMVYLRDGASVVSRPEILAGELPAAAPETPLARAMATPPWEGLTDALHQVLGAAVADDRAASGTIETLISLSCSLNGLPPSSFEVLRLLPGHPGVLARMVLFATADQRTAVLALSDALPFAWCTIPKRCWEEAGAAQFSRVLQLLGGMDGAVGYAAQAMADVASRIADAVPLLAPVLKGASAPASRMDVAQVFTRRVIDGRAIGHAAGSRYRVRDLPLPADHLRLPEAVLEWLDTPYAAALAVQGKWTPAAADIRHIKTVARNFPSFFADAFAASLQELS